MKTKTPVPASTTAPLQSNKNVPLPSPELPVRPLHTRDAAPLTRASVLSLQRSAGNQAVGRAIQARLRVRQDKGSGSPTIVTNVAPDQTVQQEAASVGSGAVSAVGQDNAIRVHEAARVGIGGVGGRLPHLEKIQASFGQYDLSHVQAHTDAAAAFGARAMGAEAFATGSHIAFSGTPSLHLAAHEAAHAVQQQAGVQLAGGVGKVGDRYEQHADAVADRVVQGKSSEDLWTGFSGRAGSNSAMPVQRFSKKSLKNPSSINWAAETQSVKRSGEGQFGVFFFTSKDGGELVVKPETTQYTAPANVMFANEFFSKGMGLEAPTSVVVAKQVPEGQVIAEQIVGNPPKGKLDATQRADPTLLPKIVANVENADYFFVMEKLSGKSLSAMIGDVNTLDELAEFVGNLKLIMKEIGRMIFADAFLGNEDRISHRDMNLGNVMVDTIGKPRLLTLDSNTSIKPVKTEFERNAYVNALENIALSEEQIEAMLDGMLDTIQKKLSIGILADADKNEIKKLGKAGATEGRRQVTGIFKNSTLKKSLKKTANSDYSVPVVGDPRAPADWDLIKAQGIYLASREKLEKDPAAAKVLKFLALRETRKTIPSKLGRAIFDKRNK